MICRYINILTILKKALNAAFVCALALCLSASMFPISAVALAADAAEEDAAAVGTDSVAVADFTEANIEAVESEGAESPEVSVDAEVSPAADSVDAINDDAFVNLTFEQACEIAGINPDGSYKDANASGTADAAGAAGNNNDSFSAQSISPFLFQRLIGFALQYNGWRYLWGGKYPSQGGFDCSGLVTWSYNSALGSSIDGWNTNSERLASNYSTYVSPGQARPGDLVFWKGTYKSINYVSHVGIYCGGNLAFSANSSGVGYCYIDKFRNMYGRNAEYFFATLNQVDQGPDAADQGVLMYRMYNRFSGEHFYTASAYERDSLRRGDWNYEGIGWIAPTSGDPVFRLYNPGLGDHHYTMSVGERDVLVANHGWIYEGIGWYSGGNIPLLRQYNPGLRRGQHNYTASQYEFDVNNANYGWLPEGIGWYAISY